MPKGNCPQTNPQVYCPHNRGQCRPISQQDQICIHVGTLDKAQKVGTGLFLVMQRAGIELSRELCQDLEESIGIMRE